MFNLQCVMGSSLSCASLDVSHSHAYRIDIFDSGVTVCEELWQGPQYCNGSGMEWKCRLGHSHLGGGSYFTGTVGGILSLGGRMGWHMNRD